MWLQHSYPGVRQGRSRPAALHALTALLVAASAACFKLNDDDCALSSTCPGQPIAEYAALRGERCAECVRTECAQAAKTCDQDPVCKNTAKCSLQPNPGALQRCFAGVLTSGPPDAGANAPPWNATRRLEACVDTFCEMPCKRDTPDWSCIDDPDYQLSDDDNSELVLYVSFFDNGLYNPARDVRVSYCLDDPRNCSDAGHTNDAGVFELPKKWVRAGIYFKLEDEEPRRFPTTLFYPRPIEGGGRQPIAIYLVTSSQVGVSNDALLGGDAGVLADRAQSVVLTDACRLLSSDSAEGVTIQVASVSTLEVCKGDGQSSCVWYGGASLLPEPGRTVSLGTSSGVLGLSRGEYEIQACSDGKLVASRSVWMVPGWLTFARLRPLTDRERRGHDDAACPQ